MKHVCLSIAQKTKLIEILLIVGSIIAAFKLPINLIWMFILFVIFSILYYILIQNNLLKKGLLSRLISFLVASLFSGVLIYHFVISLAQQLYPPYKLLIYLIFFMFYGLLTLFIFVALSRNR